MVGIISIVLVEAVKFKWRLIVGFYFYYFAEIKWLTMYLKDVVGKKSNTVANGYISLFRFIKRFILNFILLNPRHIKKRHAASCYRTK